MKAMGWGLGGSLALRRGLGGGGVGGTSGSSLASSQMQPGSSMEHEGGGASSFARATDAALLGGGAGWRLLTGHESGQVREVALPRESMFLPHFPYFPVFPLWYPLLIQYVMLRPSMSHFTHSHTFCSQVVMWHPESTRLTPLMHIMEQGSPIRCGGYGWG